MLFSLPLLKAHLDSLTAHGLRVVKLTPWYLSPSMKVEVVDPSTG